MDSDLAIVEIATAERYRDLTESGVFVYLEVNYKSNIPCLFGYIVLLM